MPGTCSHEFFWPLRAADGNYYQVCRLCGVQYAYDWDNMRRLRGGARTSLTSGAKAGAQRTAAPLLSLLVELEPRRRVFLRNLSELFQPPAGTFWSAAFWREVVADSGLPWQRFAESMVCHLVALAVVLLLSQMWRSQDLPQRRSPFENSQITYYKPDGSYPALRGNPAPVQRASRKQIASARQGAIRVAPERVQAAIGPPDIKLNGPARPNIVAPNLAPPEMPLASTQSSRLNVPAGAVAVVAPPPEVSQGTSRRLGLPQITVVAPAPEVGAFSSRYGMTAARAAVGGTSAVGPAPIVQASARRLGDLSIGPSTVVAPAPRLPLDEQGNMSGMAGATLGGPIALAVPPAPSTPRSGSLGRGRGGSLSGSGLQVVPPSPSLQAIEGAANSAGGGPLNSLSRGPASSGSSSVGSLSGGLDSGSGAQVVPPSPSLEGTGNGGTGRGSNLLSGTGVQGVAPAPSVGDGGSGSGRDGRQMAMNIAPALAPAAPVIANAQPQAASKAPDAPTEEMPLRLIGLAMALPSSSYFSNYEVYIAERRMRKNLTELVKLVYVYLPYQRRLSEYGVDNSKVYKLLVSRDKTCDESLMQMTWPENDPHPDAHNATDSPALSAEDKKSMLPCYRTTADDYRKAMSRR
ncbi:MAG: hypothetical protein ACRD20_06385 [Terriglobales bacterium]